MSDALRPSPEIEFDILSDPGFIPCRKEACPRGGLHRAHGPLGVRGPNKRSQKKIKELTCVK